MASPQCCTNPPALNPAAGEGKVVDSFGGIPAYVVGAEDSKAAVVLISDVFGFEAPNLRKIADKVASSGYFVVVPDFLHGDPYAPENTERPIQVWIKEHTQQKGFEEAKPVIAALKEKGVSSIGAAGYCWGAKVVAELAKAHMIHAAVMLHPSFVTVDDIKEVKCPIAILGAEIDRTSPPELVKQFEQVLSSNSGMAHFIHNKPSQLGGWVEILLKMLALLGYSLGITFHSENVLLNGRFLQFRAWVRLFQVKGPTGRPMIFFGYRQNQKAAIQDAARNAIRHIRQQFADVFTNSSFEWMPAAFEDGGTEILEIEASADHRVEALLDYVLYLDAKYTHATRELDRTHFELHMAQTERNLLQQRLGERELEEGYQSECGESSHPAPVRVRPAMKEDVAECSRKTGNAQVYRRFFRRAMEQQRNNQVKQDEENEKGKQVIEEDADEETSSEEEEDPEEIIHYTSSNPPSDIDAD